MPAEAVLRNMYYAGRLERSENLDLPLVMSMENQTLPGGVASLWAGSGAQYSWKGICHCATKIDAANRPREIYHFQGPDGQSVCMKWNTWVGAGSIGGYAEARDINGAVNYLDTNSGFLSRWPWPVSGAFGYGADDLQTTTNGFINASLSLSNANRRVIVSNQIDFFEDFRFRPSRAASATSGTSTPPRWAR
jgi:alpha-mannosidase